MSNVKISGFPVPFALPVAATINGTETVPVDQTVGGVITTVSTLFSRLLGSLSVTYPTGLVSVTAIAASNALDVIGNSGVTSFTGATKLGLRVNGATGTTDYSGIDFTSTNTTPQARIAGIFSGGGSSLVFGTSNNYGTGITNSALTIDPNGVVTVAGINASSFFVGNTAVTGQVSAFVNNTSTTAGDDVRFGVTAGASQFALFVENAANASTIITGGLTGAQSVLRNLGSYPMVFGTNNTYRGDIGATGTWTLAPTANSAIPSQLVKIIDGSGGIVLDVQSASTGGFMSFKNSGVERGFVGTGPICTTGAALGDMTIGCDTGTLRFTCGSTSRMAIGAGGNVAIAAPTTAGLTALTATAQATNTFCASFNANGINTVAVVFINGNAAGVEALRIDTSATTGAGVPTFANNKPGASTSTAKWLPISCDGVRGYIPVWS